MIHLPETESNEKCVRSVSYYKWHSTFVTYEFKSLFTKCFILFYTDDLTRLINNCVVQIKHVESNETTLLTVKCYHLPLPILI